eukprot:TRINITY_DN37864_c0_g1_i1.p1 TRINITY_DN37864_c0_g1~~TRINITY_DN37864_c0_g1_i1.p1  ORF type:complete len:299 (+),score=50.40 TRINITY_DN37864_c0_g1_i1:95-898(+)
MLRSLVGSEMCIRDSINAEYGEPTDVAMGCGPSKLKSPAGAGSLSPFDWKLPRAPGGDHQGPTYEHTTKRTMCRFLKQGSSNKLDEDWEGELLFICQTPDAGVRRVPGKLGGTPHHHAGVPAKVVIVTCSCRENRVHEEWYEGWDLAAVTGVEVSTEPHLSRKSHYDNRPDEQLSSVKLTIPARESPLVLYVEDYLVGQVEEGYHQVRDQLPEAQPDAQEEEEEFERVTVTCPQCDGSGIKEFFGKPDVTCPNCSGTGTRFKMQRVE